MKIGTENEKLEFKKTTAELKEGVISIAAMLNKHGGGELYFGVLNDGSPVGQMIGANTLRDIADNITDNITINITDNDVINDVENGNSIGVYVGVNDNSVGVNVGANVGVNGNSVGVNKTQLKIITLLSENPHITAQKLSELLGITKRRVESNLKKLKELEIIKRVGAAKNGHWVVLHKGGGKSG